MNIGIILPHLASSQLAYKAIMFCNVGSVMTEDNFFIFTKNPSEPCVQPGFSCMNISEVAGFQGLLIATDLESAQLALSVPTQAKLVFYVWDLEFLRSRQDFLSNMSVYRNPRLSLVCRSEDHARVVDNYTNRTPQVIKKFNILEIKDKV